MIEITILQAGILVGVGFIFGAVSMFMFILIWGSAVSGDDDNK